MSTGLISPLIRGHGNGIQMGERYLRDRTYLVNHGRDVAEVRTRRRNTRNRIRRKMMSAFRRTYTTKREQNREDDGVITFLTPFPGKYSLFLLALSGGGGTLRRSVGLPQLQSCIS